MQEDVVAIYIQTLVTLIVGGVAYFIYKRQRSDHKKDAANSILLEIQSGESAISKVRDAIQKDNLDVDLSVMPSESWSKNKHLFVRNFDQDEWEQLSEFYNKAALIDESIRYNKTAFSSDVEQIRTNKQRVLATYAEEAVTEALYPVGIDAPPSSADNVIAQQVQEKYDSKAKLFDKLYMGKQADFSYKPNKPIYDVKLYLTDLPKLTTSSAGIKLKKLAGLER